MSDDDTEAMEAAIIRRVYRGGYSHAETILHRLTHLHREHSHEEAVAIIHAEVHAEEP